jgi:hypothetical protein
VSIFDFILGSGWNSETGEAAVQAEPSNVQNKHQCCRLQLQAEEILAEHKKSWSGALGLSAIRTDQQSRRGTKI